MDCSVSKGIEPDNAPFNCISDHHGYREGNTNHREGATERARAKNEIHFTSRWSIIRCDHLRLRHENDVDVQEDALDHDN